MGGKSSGMRFLLRGSSRMADLSNFNWYPGHMAKARRTMQEDMKKVDLCIELLDARIPISSRNPDIDILAKGKYRLILLNKADLADDKRTKEWIDVFGSQGIRALALDARMNTSLSVVRKAMESACAEKRIKDTSRGIAQRPIRAMVCGIPNVGKSTFINSLAGKASLKTGNKPGVTKANQWITISNGIQLLDTPGVLWPKFEDSHVGLNLAFIGSINEDILPKEELAYEFVKMCNERGFIELLNKRYDILLQDSSDPNEIIDSIGRKRNCVKKGGGTDVMKASVLILEDFKAGRLGRITLE